MNTHDRFPLGWTGWISLYSKGLSRVFPNHNIYITLNVCVCVGVCVCVCVCVAQLVKNLPAVQETWVQSLGQEDPLEKEIANSSILAWKIPQTEEPSRL